MQLNLLKATQILERTMPVMNRRILIYAAITLGLLFSIPLGAGSFFGLASFSDNPGFWGQIGAAAGLIGALYGYRIARPALFFHLDLPQLFAIVKRITGAELPSGKALHSQLKQQVQALFSEPRTAWEYRLKLKQVIAQAFTANATGNPSVATKTQALQKALVTATMGFAADAMLAPVIKEMSITALRRSALTFCENFQIFFRYSLILNAFLYTILLIAFWVLLKPVGWVDEALPISLGIWKPIFAAILTFWIKTVFLDPIVTTAMTLNLLSLSKEAGSGDGDRWTEILAELEPSKATDAPNEHE